jgi:hypothetical protein
MANTKWNRSLGTSKREQGIVTPKQPRKHKCGCWYRSGALLTTCKDHRITEVIVNGNQEIGN